jgi:putative peptidoglycan lipid II flippase
MKFLKQSLITASAITIMANFLSRFFGYFREAINANFFGTSSGMDTFIIAFTVPEIIASVAFMSVPPAIIPLLKNYNQNRDIEESRNFWSGFYLFFIVFLFLSIAVYFFRFQILEFLMPAVDPGAANLAERILTISSGLIFFRGLEVYFRSWLFAKKHFIIPAFSNIILNIVILLCVIFLYDKINIESLAFGWLLASIVIFAINGAYAFKIVNPKLNFEISRGWINVAVKSIFAVCIIEFMASLFLIIDRYLAANYLGIGELAGLRYAFIIIALPVGVISASYNIASFPWISDMIRREDLENIKSLLKKSMNFLFFIMGFIAIFVFIFPEEIVTLAFQRGKFTGDSLSLTSLPLKYYAIGLLFHSLYIFLIRFYYAKGKMMRLGVILFLVLFIKFAGSIILLKPLENSGLALATSIARIFGFVMIAIDMKKEIGVSLFSMITGSAFKIGSILLLSVLFFVGIKNFFPFHGDGGFIPGFVHLSLLFGGGSLLVLVVGYWINIEEIRYFVNLLKRKANIFSRNG